MCYNYVFLFKTFAGRLWHNRINFRRLCASYAQLDRAVDCPQRISQTKSLWQRMCSWIALRITTGKSVCLAVASRDLWKYCLMYAQDFTYSLQKGWNVCGGSGRRAEQHGRRNPVTEGTCPACWDSIDKLRQANRKPIQVECLSPVQQCSQWRARST